MFLLLLILFSGASSFERFSSTHRFAASSFNVIENETQPIIIGDTELYWNHQLVIGRPVHCIVHLDSEEWSFGEFRFKNGSKPLSLHYFCPVGSHCTVLTCIVKDITIPVFLFFFATAILFICFCVLKPRNNRKKAPRRKREQYEMMPTGNAVYLTSELPIDGITEIEDVIDEEPSSDDTSSVIR